MHVPKPKRKIPITRKVSNIKQILDHFEQTMDIKEKFMQHCQISTNLKRQDCTEHIHCGIPLNTQISNLITKFYSWHRMTLAPEVKKMNLR